MQTNTVLSRLLAAVLLPLCLLLCLAAPARAELSLEFSTEGVRQIPIAVLPFAQEDQLGGPLTAVVAADLQRSGFFKPVDTAGVTPLPSDPKQINMADWRARKAEHVLVGSVARLPGGQYEIKFHLVDGATGAVRVALSWTIASSLARATAHRIADVVYENILGERGVFSTKIAYIVRSGGRYGLKVADADAYNEQTVLASKEPIISPRWSPDGTRMAYVTFELKRPVVVVQNLATGNRRIVAKFRGNNSAPAWSPDGHQLAVTLSKDGIAQIYIIDADGSETPRRLMSTHAIDTEPCFAPDGRSILFTSDRGGSPQIYRVPVEGGNAVRLTFSGNYNVSPRFSPDGRKMVYVQQAGPAFRVVLQDLDSGQTQTLTDTTLDESPSFSPNGRMILYATRSGGRGTLALVSADGRVRQKFTTQAGDVYEPAWGPLP
ncbi:MAG: Tol-Pal system protein TolB [Pseudomonadota bacterium]|nr:Tol-Pal system protein TolB [Pseudomonadota bacterium]